MKAALALTAALLLQPQDPQPQMKTDDLIELKRTDGDTVVGAVVEVTKEKVKLRVPILGGSMVVTNSLADFEPQSVYRIQLAANPPKDYDGHFVMAKRAADLGLRQQAGTEARAAVNACKGDPDAEAKTKAVRAWAADALEKMVRDAATEGDLPRAKKCLEILTTRLSEQRTEEQLDAIAAVVEGLEAKNKQEQLNKRQARLDQKQRESIERNLKPIAADVERGTKTYQQAIRKNSTGASKRLCEQSIEYFKQAYRALNELVEKNPDDPTLAAAATSLGKEIHDTGIDAALHAASMLCIQSDYKGAMEWAQKVLAFDPGNADAKAMVNTITTAAAEAGDAWRWGWNIGDIGRVGDRPTPKTR